MSAFLQIKDVPVVFEFSDSVDAVLAAVATAARTKVITTSSANNGQGVLINFALVAVAEVDDRYEPNQMFAKDVWPTSVAKFFTAPA